MSDVDPPGSQPRPPEEASGVEAMQTGKPSPKRIVVCCDGTGNEFAGVDATDSNSNVVKLYTALQLDYEQYAYYHPGVGTMGDPTKKGIGRAWSMVKGLAFGSGFEENVLDAYRYLMQHYNSGDRVYIFGFSRGAYTARALAGLLHGYGLLCRGNEGHIPYAWRMYKQAMVQHQNRRTIPTDFSFRDTFSHPYFMIDFVGLWDTVSSVGWITTPLRLLHLAQNPTIMKGRHAVSIDERRCFYQDNLWGSQVEVQYPPSIECAKPPIWVDRPKMQDVLQVWFSGVHSDVGGSYPQLESKLSNITLRWMIEQAEDNGRGLTFDPIRRDMVTRDQEPREAPCLVKSIFPLYEAPKTGPVHKSLSGPWWALEFFPHRYYDRDDAKEKMRIPLGAFRSMPAGSLIHPSVKQRMQDDICYRPPSISPEEIVAPATGADVPAGYLVFEPKRCRTGGWRQNWLVVFLVSVLEVALGLILAGLLLVWAAELINWAGHLAAWFGEVLPKSGLAPTIHVLEIVKHWVKEAASAAGGKRLYWLWPLVAAVLFVGVNSLLALRRRGRT